MLLADFDSCVTAVNNKRVTVMAVNILTNIPKHKVTANPRIDPVPNQNNTTVAIKVLTFESIIVEKALSNPPSIAAFKLCPRRRSSSIRSKIITFASTAIPMVKINPAIPGNVNVAPNSFNPEKKINAYKAKAILAMTPGNR